MYNLTSQKQKGLSNTLILTVIAVLTLIIAYAWLSSRNTTPVVAPNNSLATEVIIPVQHPIEFTPLPETTDEIVRSYQLQGELPLLGSSDDPLKSHLRLLAGALPVSWLSGDQLLQKIVLQVDNISRGNLIYQHSPLVAPSGSLSVIETQEEGVYLLDTSSYSRYNLYADFVETVDQQLLIAFYRYYEPLLDQAYIKLGNEPGQFRSVLVGALELVQGTPSVEGAIRLTRPLLSYEFEDQELESLSMLEKQLLRMGPENTQKIQAGLQPLLNAISN